MSKSVVRAMALSLTLSMCFGAHASLHAQTFSSAANLSQTIPAPTAAQYSAAAPNNATSANTTTNFTVTLQSPNGGGSNPLYDLNLAFGSNPQGLQLQVQWQLVSVSSANNCGNPTVGGAFQDIPASAILTLGKNKTCTVTFAFRVAGLSYAVQQAPGANGTSTPYAQNVVFTFFDH